ncbi:MAG: hypothetical protein HXS44_06725 [Theionarchaea archaeon]|nr:hypothetical protein [Theionarchaea archaeon]
MNGVHGAFLIVDDTTAFSDTGLNMESLSKAVYYLKECLQENGGASRIYVYGKKRDLIFYLDNEFTMGVIVSKNANIHLLHRIVRKVLSNAKADVKNKEPTEDVVKRAMDFFADF